MWNVHYNGMDEYEFTPQETIVGCSYSPVILSGTGDYVIPITVNPTEFTKILSSIYAGAALNYPAEQQTIVWSFLRSFECMTSLCDLIAECIATNEAIRDLVCEIGCGEGTAGESGELPPITEENPTIAYSCDADDLFGACTQMVDLIDTLITDVFQVIEAASNGVEAASAALEFIPGLNLLGSVLEITNVLQETFAENYAAAYNATIRDELRCALFCAVLPDCTFDFLKLVEVLSDLAGQSVLTLDLEDFIEFFVEGAFSGSEVVYGAFWFAAGILQYGGSFAGISAQKFLQLTASFLNDPDGDWATLCDECTWEQEFDFTADNGGWASLNTLVSSNRSSYAAAYISGTGWRRADANTNPIGIGIAVPIGTRITQVRVTQLILDCTINAGWTWDDDDPTGTPRYEVDRHNGRANALGVQTFTDTVDYIIAGGILNLNASRCNDQNITWSSIRLRGTGTNPFV